MGGREGEGMWVRVCGMGRCDGNKGGGWYGTTKRLCGHVLRMMYSGSCCND